MMIHAALVVASLAAVGPEVMPLPLPGGEAGIGFDDLVYSKDLRKVIVPAGRSGRLDLVDPKTQKIDVIEGFSATARFAGGHGEGTTSADSVGQLIVASDRSRKRIEIVDARAGKTVGSGAKLGGTPDYVRWVEPLGEVWVTEPGRKVIECFKLKTVQAPQLVPSGTIAIPDGPESLIVDVAHERAYTNTWHDTTVVVDVRRHQVIERWPNGCAGARGIALDEEKGLLFVGCAEGRVVALDTAHQGKAVGAATAGKGVDIIAYNPLLRHLYVPGGESKTLTVVAVDPEGTLRALASVPAAAGSHCVVTDPLGHAYVCDPQKGRLLMFTDDLKP